tara:strand:+ start:1442 stop:1615 length:174 start_codon:yes stop_codon:yes gene_type:complete
MGEINGKLVEEIGFKAYSKGFFPQWQKMTSSMYENEEITYEIAAERAYNILKLQGSE